MKCLVNGKWMYKWWYIGIEECMDNIQWQHWGEGGMEDLPPYCPHPTNIILIPLLSKFFFSRWGQSGTMGHYIWRKCFLIVNTWGQCHMYQGQFFVCFYFINEWSFQMMVKIGKCKPKESKIYFCFNFMTIVYKTPEMVIKCYHFIGCYFFIQNKQYSFEHVLKSIYLFQLLGHGIQGIIFLVSHRNLLCIFIWLCYTRYLLCSSFPS